MQYDDGWDLWVRKEAALGVTSVAGTAAGMQEEKNVRYRPSANQMQR